MNYEESLNFILNKQSLGVMPGLSRILKLLESMGNPQDRIKIIHIAGTNGKGTVAKTINDALIKNGLRIGLFTSPWIMDYREQIQVNNSFISKEAFSDYIERYKINDCTEFEFLTAVMFKYFADSMVDYAVIECGMGGRGDATNVERNNVCSVLTSISVDHTAFLGSTVEEITHEKEGIIRSSPCFRYVDTGDFNCDNLRLAKKVLSFLGFSDDFDLSKPPARQQRINGILTDGGHNLSAAKALSPLLNNEVAVIGMMADKDVQGYLSLIAPSCKRIITTAPSNPRAMPAEELRLLAEKYCHNTVSVSNPRKAIAYARANELSLVCGSFYLIRDVIEDLL